MVLLTVPSSLPMRRAGKLAIAGALGLAAASTGVIVPAVRGIVEHAGYGETIAGVFTAAHVIGGVLGAAVATRVLRRAGSARGLAVVGLVASVALLLAMAATSSFALRIGLRFVDGACHLLAISALIAAATEGSAELRSRSAVTSGVAIVLGVAAGLGLGGLIAPPGLTFGVAAALSAAALVTVLAFVASPALATASPAATPRAIAVAPDLAAPRTRRPLAPGLLAFGERFIFGMLTVGSQYLAAPPRVGLVLGVFMTASVCALPIARRYAVSWGPRRLAVRSTVAFTLALGAAAVVDVYASVGAALVWAITCGASAGALYASALVLAARSTVLEDRARDMAAVHAAGSGGHALGMLAAGVLVGVLPGTLLISIPGVGVIVAATLGAWITMPEAARECPVIGPLASLGDGALASPPPAATALPRE